MIYLNEPDVKESLKPAYVINALKNFHKAEYWSS